MNAVAASQTDGCKNKILDAYLFCILTSYLPDAVAACLLSLHVSIFFLLSINTDKHMYTHVILSHMCTNALKFHTLVLPGSSTSLLSNFSDLQKKDETPLFSYFFAGDPSVV